MPAVLAAAREEARMSPVRRISTLARLDRERRTWRLQSLGTVAGCAMIMLLLAAVGLYAMMGISVGQRRREIGVRVALGAHARQVTMLFLAGGLRTTLTGLAIGFPLSIAGLAFLAYGNMVPWIDVPRSAGLVTLAVVIVGSLASWLPARRAATVDPMVALRAE